MEEVGRLGGDEGGLKELRVLNRVIQWTPAGLRYEADPRHAEIVVRGVAGADRAFSVSGTCSKDLLACLVYTLPILRGCTCLWFPPSA